VGKERRVVVVVVVRGSGVAGWLLRRGGGRDRVPKGEAAGHLEALRVRA